MHACTCTCSVLTPDWPVLAHATCTCTCVCDVSSGDQWENPMFRMMGATEVGHAPERNDFSPMAIFSFVWMFIGGIFAINLFVGTRRVA